ncbi:class I SAM-dependent methyltransferase [Nocardia pseudobrasiliensis]|uniref:S-adenosyl-L-methionine-dependent methyltransferase n=1 Tax=Nocardia pseudobrasiliensis TaxID=45979 RepID=A0A370IAW4_9NOCA|nr:class I SAM-dependent methyltransferase [Nocardia pseudobrasiliensis]RDI67271.1 methyltransferase (TIGR00027 family) [Nocardia pseudobrasiliensis]
MADKQASRTAVMVCQGRAIADGRLAVGRFADPIAMRLLRADERAVVEGVRAGTPPRSGRDRIEYGLLGSVATVLATRTVPIDEAVRAQGNSQLVILGAGLDARAWRMPELADVEVFEVDHPASQANKRDRVDGLEPIAKSVTYVPVDFTRDQLDSALRSAGFRESVPTTWIWEGVLNYLTAAAVASTLTVISELSSPGSRLIATYPTPSHFRRLGPLLLRVSSKLAGAQNPLRNEPQLSAWTPEQMRELVEAHGLVVSADLNLLAVADELSVAMNRARVHGLGRAVVADKPR